ncbi:MAG: metallophosphoesterase, partial [Flavobacteriaceae bacterium]|nr:metallophosphoesterase [Flavobacteriaceae bacterium]
MGILKKNKSILVISDTHFPYQHPSCIEYLKEVKRVYKPDRVVHIGDEIDGHAISFHSHDPDLLSPSDEFQLAIERLQPLYSLFPKVDVIESN